MDEYVMLPQRALEVEVLLVIQVIAIPLESISTLYKEGTKQQIVVSG